MRPSAASPVVSPGTASALVRAARGERVDPPPVWFMRQAGRSLPEYRRVRGQVPMLEACLRPELVTEITLQPVRRHHVDAAILFSDIVVPLAVAGVDVDIVAGIGPVIGTPIRQQRDLDSLRPLAPDQLSFVTEAVSSLVTELGPTPLVGFAGAPFTLASYLVEGGPSRDHTRTKALMLSDQPLWHQLMSRLAELSAMFLQAQIAAGVSAVQLFDSWAGTLSEPHYRQFVQPYSAAVFAQVADVPRIHFGVGTGELLAAMRQAGPEVVGVDWRTGLDVAVSRLRAAGSPGPTVVQGNIDPAVLFADWDVVEAEVRRVVELGQSADGHIVNLGHGVLPETDPDVITRVVELVHSL